MKGNVFTETSNDGGCKTNVSFKYTFDGKNLTFSYVGNPDDDTACSGRHADFNDVTYILAQDASAFPTGTFVDAQDKDKLRGYVFNGNMTWKYFTLGTGSTAASGTYSVKGNRWVDAGGGGDNCQPGTHEWSFDGTNLAFRVVGEDACNARKASLDGHAFVLTP